MFFAIYETKIELFRYHLHAEGNKQYTDLSMGMSLRLGKRRDMDMTAGSILPQIVSFALPLFLGSLFQQLYNTVDTWVVGNFVGKNSFSAVGTLSSVTNLAISFFMGFSSGASVIISHYFGAKDSENVNRTTHTFIAVTLVLCAVLTVAGQLIIPLVLKILKSPAEVAFEQNIYLRIYFGGITGLLIYNMGSAVLRAVGDSFHPFMFLMVSASLNIVLDIVFVTVFKMGTAGVAYATIISQAVSAVLVMRVLFTTSSGVRKPTMSKKCPGSGMAEKPSGRTASVRSSASLSCASRNLCRRSLQGYPPYRKEGS